MTTDDIHLDASAVAHEFLDQWAKACASCDGVDPKEFLSRDFQNRLAGKYAQFSGWPISLGEADAVFHELRKQRIARGWPDPTPQTIEPTIEGAILMIWLGGLRVAERSMMIDDFLRIDPPPAEFFDGPEF